MQLKQEFASAICCRDTVMQFGSACGDLPLSELFPPFLGHLNNIAKHGFDDT